MRINIHTHLKRAATATRKLAFLPLRFVQSFSVYASGHVVRRTTPAAVMEQLKGSPPGASDSSLTDFVECVVPHNPYRVAAA